MTVRVVFADDSFLVGEGLAGLLQETAKVELLASVGNTVELLAAVAEHRPEAVLTDNPMPPTFTTEGLVAAKRMQAEFPETGGGAFAACERASMSLDDGTRPEAAA